MVRTGKHVRSKSFESSRTSRFSISYRGIHHNHIVCSHFFRHKMSQPKRGSSLDTRLGQSTPWPADCRVILDRFDALLESSKMGLEVGFGEDCKVFAHFSRPFALALPSVLKD